MDSKQHHSSSPVKVPSTEHTCPICGESGISTSMQQESLTYGSGEAATELSVDLPVRYCSACEFQFLDAESEEIKQEAICEHLGVLPPSAIESIRKKYRLSRARFAEITGLGEASLSRWERGINIQNPGIDRYIRLLENPRVMQELREISDRTKFSSLRPDSNVIPFPNLHLTRELKQRQAAFRLRKAT